MSTRRDALRLLVLLCFFASTATSWHAGPVPTRRRVGQAAKQGVFKLPLPLPKEAPCEKPRKGLFRMAAVALALNGRRLLASAALALPRLGIAAWRMLPHKLPSWWRSTGLTTNGFGQAAFLASNVAYLFAGCRLIWAPSSLQPISLGVSMLVVCVASCAYHAAQCLHGCDSTEAARNELR